MNRIKSVVPSWDKTKTTSKAGFDKTWKAFDKLGAPVNRWSNKIGSEAFWPTTLDKESDKAARILKTFCKDGFYVEEDRPNQDEVKGKQRVLKKIPQKVIENAVGLAIFTTMRTGLWVSGAGGSGVLIARQENGEWSPPSGILLHTAGLGFLVGIDIYDCVVVINNRKALEAFTHIRATLGGEISAVAGPFGVGGVLENDGKWKQANRPVFTYLKSRGFYAGIQVDGTVIIERTDENERFYGERIGVSNILAGKVRHPPYEIKMLMETVKAAEGRTDVDEGMMQELEDQPAPADLEIQSPSTPIFGVPEPDDPDPFGVLALENAGMEIREAGSKSRPPSTQFDFNPSPTSPIYGKFHRRSMDTLATRSNRESYMSTRSGLTRTSVDQATQTVDMSTQTEETPGTSPSYSDEHKRIIEEEEPQASPQKPIEPEEVDYTKIDLGPYANLNHSQDLDGTTINNESPREHETSGETSYNDEEDDDEEAVIFEAASAQATMIAPTAIKARGGLVNIPKRPPPPPLPPRSNARGSKALMIDQGSGRSPGRSPTKEGFEEVDLHGVDKADRKSGEQSGIVMEDLEKDDEPVRKSIDEKVEEALKEEHLEELQPVGETKTNEARVQDEIESLNTDLKSDEVKDEEMKAEAMKHESEEMKAEAMKHESEEMQIPGGFGEDEKFHSLPTTPLEIPS